MTVLIVLDNVDDVDQILALLPFQMMNKLGRGSMIIVTTRDTKVVQKYWKNSTIYQMKPLDDVKAKELFCRHAFPADRHDPSSQLEFEDLIEKFVKVCKGLPLSLKVFGAMVNELDKEYWGLKLSEIKEELPEEIVKHLKPSYDALDRRGQQMFLDAACFFIGVQKSFVLEIWDGSGWRGHLGWENLVNKCLVGVDKEGYIEMHDHLRDLGRKIAGDASPSRIWNEEQINNQDGTTPIRGIMFRDSWPAFEHCIETIRPSLRALQLFHGTQMHFLEAFTADLVWFRSDDYCVMMNLPSWLSLKNLRVLELYSAWGLEELWQDNEPPLQLRVLSILEGYSLRGLPRSVGRLRHLKTVILGAGGCCEMRSLPEEFCNLESLEILELSEFRYLSSLPGDFGKLRNLRSLSFWELEQLSALPDSFNQLTALPTLYIFSCESLMFSSDMLHVLDFMKELQELTISRCPQLKLPHLTNQVSSLRVLELGSSYNLKILPGYLRELSCLTFLGIYGCQMSESLSEAFGCLSNLRELKISLTSMVQVGLGMGSASACNLRSLKSLSLRILTGVRWISISDDGCPSLETLCLEYIKDLTEIEKLPGNVRDITVLNCKNLKSMRGIGGLLNLRRLEVWKCPELEELPCPTHMHSNQCEIDACPKINRSGCSDGMCRGCPKIHIRNDRENDEEEEEED